MNIRNQFNPERDKTELELNRCPQDPHPYKDANDIIKTAFTIIRKLRYKLNRYSRAQTCSCCLRFYRLRGEAF